MEFLSAGVYNEERPSGASPITGVSTSNFAAVGYTPRGPADYATLVTSFEQFLSTFGSYTKYSDLALAITAFFNNGGLRAYIVRVVADDAAVAEKVAGSLWRFEAISAGAWGNLVRVKIAGSENYYDVTTATYSRFDVMIEEESVDGEADYNTQEMYEALVLDDKDDKDYIVSVLNDQSELVKVIDLGNGGIPSDLQSTQYTDILLGTGDGTEDTFSTSVSGMTEVAEGTFKVMVDNVLFATDNDGIISGIGVSGSIDYSTGAITIVFTVAPTTGAVITADFYKKGSAFMGYDLENGSDGDPTTIGRAQISEPGLELDKRGIYAMNNVEEMFSIAVPDLSDDPTVTIDLIGYAETRKDAFVICDAPEGYNPQKALKYKRQTLASLSTYGAMYYPKVTIADPLKDGRPRNISAVGHVAGVIARTDTNRNVGKAPAGVNDGRLNFALGLERQLSRGEMDLIYPANINPLWVSTATGRVVWGARTLALTGDWSQINSRRLFQFLEKSIFNQTHDVVFENIGTDLWTKVKIRVDGFFYALYQDNYFKGSAPSDAYYIICDESNNPPSIQQQRMLIVDYGVAVNEPAEFVRHRFQRKYD